MSALWPGFRPGHFVFELCFLAVLLREAKRFRRCSALGRCLSVRNAYLPGMRRLTPIAIGLVLGIAIGAMMDNIGMGIGIGIALGIAMGSVLRNGDG